MESARTLWSHPVSQASDPHVISRSKFGRLRIRFDGGCSYPTMLDSLHAVYKRTGGLIAPGGDTVWPRLDQSNYRKWVSYFRSGKSIHPHSDVGFALMCVFVWHICELLGRCSRGC